jgi:hypothetical protein
MCLILVVIIMVIFAITSGCTSPATKLAIEQYQAAEKHQQNAFDNTYRIAKEQMLIGLKGHLASTKPEDPNVALTAAWEARDQLEECRVQYIYGRSMSLVTAGQYLYGQQGILNIWAEEAMALFHPVKPVAPAASPPAATQSATQSILGLLKPTTGPAK